MNNVTVIPTTTANALRNEVAPAAKHPSKVLLACLIAAGLSLVSFTAHAAYNLSTYVPAPITITPTGNVQQALVKVPAYGYQDFYFHGATCCCGRYTLCTFSVNDPVVSLFPTTITVYDPWGNIVTSAHTSTGQKTTVQFWAWYDDEYEVVVSSYGIGGSTYMSYYQGCYIW